MPLVKPEAVEIVAQIVVVVDVVPRSTGGVGVRPRYALQYWARPWPHRRPVYRLQKSNKVTVNVDTAVGVCLAKLEVGVVQQSEQRPPISDLKRADRWCIIGRDALSPFQRRI